MSAQDSSTALGRVRALGSAHHGGHHWLRERLTSAALLLLGIWFIGSLIMLPSLDQRTVSEWLKSAGGFVPMTLFVITAFIHATDGLKVVVDDYVHEVGNNLLLNGLILFAGTGAGALALFSLFKIAFGGAA